MSQAILLNPFENGKNPTPEQLSKYQKLYGQLKNEVVAQNKQTSSSSTKKLKDYLQRLQSIKQIAHNNRVSCQQKIGKLQEEALEYKAKIDKIAELKGDNHSEDQLKSKIVDEQKLNYGFVMKRIQLAKNLDLLKFKKLEIQQRKSPAHQLFKWILVAIYGEPESKYYWDNFKEQALEEDQGQDLRERLGKTSGLLAKEEHKVQTAKFLANFQNIKNSPQLANYQQQAHTIYKIAKLFQNSIEVAKRIKEYRKKIQEIRKIQLKVSEQNSQNFNTYTSLKQRISVSEAYLGRLRAVQSLIDEKIPIYQSQISLAQSFLSDMNKVGTYELRLASDKKEDCQCSVY